MRDKNINITSIELANWGQKGLGRRESETVEKWGTNLKAGYILALRQHRSYLGCCKVQVTFLIRMGFMAKKQCTSSTGKVRDNQT